MSIVESTSIPTKRPFGDRIKLEAVVHYGPCPETILSGLTDNLSVGGMYLKTKIPLDIDETIMLSFSLPSQNQEKTVNCKASVAWTNFDTNPRKPDLPSGVGLKFVDLLREDMLSIARFIDQYDENTKMDVTCAWCNSPLGERRGPTGKTSHGICQECLDEINGSKESRA